MPGSRTAGRSLGDRRPPADFAGLVRDALRQLHDPVRLQRHPLTRLVPCGRPGISAGEALRRQLLEGIAALRPEGAAAPGEAGRRQRLLVLRYAEGRDPAAVQATLALGRSEYFAEQREALAALTSLLAERWGLEPERHGLTAGLTREALAERADLEALVERWRGPSPALSGSPTSPLLVGRDREQARLRERLAATLAGRGGVVLLSGEAGIGKTALGEALGRAGAAAGALALVGRCYDLSQTPPYGPWREALARVGPTAGLPPSPFAATDAAGADSQGALFAQARAFLASLGRRRPVTILLEDLHWADLASLDLLRCLGRDLADLPLLLVATYRSDEVARRHPLYRLLPLLAREARAELIEVRRLEADELRALARDRYALAPPDEDRLVAYLAARSGGNPFYAGELLRSLEGARTLRPPVGTEPGGVWTLDRLDGAPVPMLLRQVIEARADRLGADARRLLAAAAVVGQEAGLDLWAAVAGTDEHELLPLAEGALEARLLADADIGVRFPHALIREALYTGLPGPERHALHRRAAEALLARPSGGVGDPDPDAVAYHLRRAMDPRAVGWLLRAGERAGARHAPQAAIDALTRALDAPVPLHGAERLRAYRARGAAYETTGDYAAARADGEAALELARAAGDRQAEWQALLDLGMLWAARDYARTEGYYQQALDRARADGDSVFVARSVNRLGNWHLNMDRPRVAERYHAEALAAFRVADDRAGVAETLDFLGMAMMLAGDLHRARAYYEEAIDRFRALGDPHGLSSALATSAELAGTLMPGLLAPISTLAEADRAAATALQTARDIGWRAGEAYALSQVGMLRIMGGEFGPALAVFREQEHIATAIGHRMWLMAAHALQALVYLYLLAPEAARPHAEQSAALARELGSGYAQRGATITNAWVALLRGEFAGAAHLLDTVTGAAFAPDSVTHLWAWSLRAELALARADAAEAARIVDRLIPALPGVAAERPPVMLAIVRGTAYAALGRTDEAEADLRAAVQDAHRQGAGPFRWRAHLALARLYAAMGRDEAGPEFAAARASAADLAATVADDDLRSGFLADVDRLIAEARTPARPAARTHPAALTPREREVLRLVAEGRSDREIAAALTISPRTAMTHVARILGKLGVGSRTAAATQAIRRGLV